MSPLLQQEEAPGQPLIHAKLTGCWAVNITDEHPPSSFRSMRLISSVAPASGRVVASCGWHGDEWARGCWGRNFTCSGLQQALGLQAAAAPWLCRTAMDGPTRLHQVPQRPVAP